MLTGAIHFAWREPETVRQFCTGVCLHGHTMHSEECLSFLPRHLRCVPGAGAFLYSYERGPKQVDFSRAFWTPPFSPVSALALERAQIAAMGMRPLVSLTDHDNIEAAMGLQVTAEPGDIPISVEWTVPYERSILHLGIHNLPAAGARVWMSEFSAYTAAPREEMLPDLLIRLAATPDILIVLNHPFWLEEGVEEVNHRRALDRVARDCIEWLHTLELNGTRGWTENNAVIELARAHNRPLVSGGDRHACEPSACLNLTDAESFPAFVAEIREGHSSLLFMPQYREPMSVRLLQAAWEILRPYPEYPGREQWSDRIFYRGEDGVARPLSVVWRGRIPWVVNAATGCLKLSATTKLRGALRFFLTQEEDLLP